MPRPSPSEPDPTEPTPARYARQVLYENIGIDGQRRLARARVVLIGCGALGSTLADILVRAGVGHLRICDRDYIEPDNLQRQTLFDEDDIAANLPKAEAAAAKLARINADVTVEPVVTDVAYTNIVRLAQDAELLLDGTDNFETRYLINDLAVRSDRPWVYGAVVAASGLCMTVIPHETPCLRCMFEEPPPPGMSPTCDTIGVLASTVHVVASVEAVEAIKLLTGRRDEISRGLFSFDVWTGRFVRLSPQTSRSEDCPCCGRGEFPFLDGRRAPSTITLCGRGAVQVNLGAYVAVDFAAVADRLAAVTTDPVPYNEYMLRARIGEYDMTLFADGRAIIKGTTDPDQARTLYARYFGV